MNDTALETRGVTFAYAGAVTPALVDVSLAVDAGAFALVVGGTGAGKSTFLRLAVPALAPAGSRTGSVEAFGVDVGSLRGADAATVGLVLQDADAQLVCDDVRGEMAFGLENLGLPRGEIARRVAETATFLGMTPWFDRRVDELSGGQRQTLALAATLVMRPRLLLLDEPVAQLDPVAAAAFAALVGRANRELGVTVVVATHSPAVFVPFATCAFTVDHGHISPTPLQELASSDPIVVSSTKAPTGVAVPNAHWHSDAAAFNVAFAPKPKANDGQHGSLGESRVATPASRISDASVATEDADVAFHGDAAATAAASTFVPSCGVAPTLDRLPAKAATATAATIVTIRDAWFRHARGETWVFTGLDLDVRAGEVHVLLGGNGSGKTTLLRLVAGAASPQRGRVANARARSMGYLPQGVRALIGCESVRDELMAWSPTVGYDKAEALRCLANLGFDPDDALLARHPHDLSGGEQRLLALAKVLLARPRLLLLDEPSVGLDAIARGVVARAIGDVAAGGAGVLLATHDLALARAVGTTVSLLFDGRVAVSEPAAEFFDRAWLWGA